MIYGASVHMTDRPLIFNSRKRNIEQTLCITESLLVYKHIKITLHTLQLVKY